jgi:DNA-binding response OmpR family regulator
MEQVNTCSVLLVEDEPPAIEIARIAAASSDCVLDLNVLEGSDAALDWIRDNAAASERMPNVIFIDLKLPKLEGLAVLRTMRNSPALQNIPIIVFSAEHNAADVVMGYCVGANSFVPKPADAAQFGELFREQLEYWMQRRNKEAAAADECVRGQI